MLMVTACANDTAPSSRTVLLRSPVRSEFVSAAQVRLILDSPRDEEDFTKASVFSTKRYSARRHLQPARLKHASLSSDECLACGQPGHAPQLESSMASYLYQVQVCFCSWLGTPLHNSNRKKLRKFGTSHRLQVQGQGHCCNLMKLVPSSMEAVTPLMTQGADKLCDNLSILAAKG